MINNLQRLVYENWHQDLKRPLVRADSLTIAMGGKLPSNTVPANVVGMINKKGYKVVCHADDVMDDVMDGVTDAGDDKNDEAILKSKSAEAKSKACSRFVASSGADANHESKHHVNSVPRRNGLPDIMCLQGVSAIGALYCDDVTIVGQPCDNAISVMFPDTQP